MLQLFYLIHLDSFYSLKTIFLFYTSKIDRVYLPPIKMDLLYDDNDKSDKL